MGIRLYVGCDAGTVQGEKTILTGHRCFTAAIRPKTRLGDDLHQVTALMDSGAFSDKPEQRLTPALALQRQLEREGQWNRFCGVTGWQAQALVSYDRLIDETWVDGKKQKRRWGLKAAELAVEQTVEAAHYIASRRRELMPRQIVLACQGVDAIQYHQCVLEVLKVAQPGDWIGLGGWCILGLYKSWLPTFWQTLRLILPAIAAAGLSRVHIFGVLYEPALGGLLYLADQQGLEVSTDSGSPVEVCTWKDSKRAGARQSYWRDNVRHWVETLETLRDSKHYHVPPCQPPCRQLSLY